MASSEIQNWKLGLDTRRSELTSLPGTLETFTNGHINQGGEIEKRKAFVRTALPVPTFGWQETTSGIYVFGSWPWVGTGISTTAIAAFNVVSILGITFNGGHNPLLPTVGSTIIVTGSGDSGVNGTFTIIQVVNNGSSFDLSYSAPGIGDYSASEITNITFDLSGQFPAPVVYQLLTHPQGVSVTLTGVVCSTYFNGKIFAVTTWSNGDTLAFYGGVVITDFYVGEQGNNEATPQAMAQDFVNALNASGNYTATINALMSLFFLVTGGSSGTISVSYQFPIPRLVTPNLLNQTVQLVSGLAWTTNNNTTAAALATAIAAATDAYAGGPGTNLGFLATGSSGNQVDVVSPFGINAGDSLIVTVTGDVKVYNPPVSATFNVYSIPTQSSSKPYTVNEQLNGIGLTNKLVSTGVPATAGASAVGQFTIYNGSSNAFALGVLTESGQPTGNQTFTLGPTTYTFVTALTGNLKNQVLIGATASTTIANLANAVNAGTGSGSVYSSDVTANTAASASIYSGTVLHFAASIGGTGGNATIFSTTVGNFALTAFTGGGPDTNQITQISVAGTNLLSTYVVYDNNPVQTAADVVTAINAFTGTSGFTANASGPIVTISSVATGTTYNNATLIVTAAGNVITANCHFIVAPTVAAGAVSSIVVGTGSNILTATITYQDGGHPGETVGAYVQRIVNNINAYSGTSGILAYADVTNAAIYLGAAVNSSADITSTVVVTATAVISGSAISILTATANTSLLTGRLIIMNNGRVQVYSLGATGLAQITPVGGLYPYTYTWSVTPASVSSTNSLINGPGPGGTISSNGINAGSTINQPPPNGVSALLTCVVTDSTPNTPQSVTVNIPVFWS